jgi:hypothetical protein
MQMLGVLGIFKARGTKFFNEMIGKTSQAAGGALTSLMPIKCLLDTQIYGPYLVNMVLPPVLALLVVVILIPTTYARRAHERFLIKHDEEMKERREHAALHDEEADDFIDPRHEPIINLGNGCFSIPRKLAVKIACCRKAATEEYIINYRRNKEGKRPYAPRFQPRFGVNAHVACGVPYATMMACAACRVKTTETSQHAWRAHQAVRKQRVHFKPLRRFFAVMVSTRRLCTPCSNCSSHLSRSSPLYLSSRA